MQVSGRSVQLPVHLPADRWSVVCVHIPTVIGLFTTHAPHAHHLRRVQVRLRSGQEFWRATMAMQRLSLFFPSFLSRLRTFPSPPLQAFSSSA